MNTKRVRYVTTILTLDKIDHSTGIILWDNNDISSFINSQEKHYGLKLINPREKVLITVEYSNIKWNYRIYFGTYKNKYQELSKDDERWHVIEKQIISDLKMIGLDKLKNEILLHLKNNVYFEYNVKKEVQFKKYCI